MGLIVLYAGKDLLWVVRQPEAIGALTRSTACDVDWLEEKVRPCPDCVCPWVDDAHAFTMDGEDEG